MIAQIATLFSRPLGTPSVLVLASVAAVALAACNKNESGSLASHSTAQRSSTSKARNRLNVQAHAEGGRERGDRLILHDRRGKRSRSESSCHYSSETDPAGLSLDLQWIEPSDYSSPAEHAALQAAGMGGAKLGGKLTESVVPNANAADGGPLHIRSGPVEGVGDEATQSMLLLTARKGDYTLMVQIVPDQ